MTDLVLHWHRRDLRFSDHLGIKAASEYSPKVVGVFCFDPALLQGDDVAAVRVAYLLGCLEALQQQYEQAGSQLIFLHGTPQDAIPKLATQLKAKTVFWSLDVEPYSQHRDADIHQQLEAAGVKVSCQWDQLLHPPGDVLTKSEAPYKVYTPFWRNWSQQEKATPVKTPSQLEGLNAEETAVLQELETISLPTLQGLGFAWENGFILEPGEEAAQDRLEEFCDRLIYHYDENRNFPALDGTSRLSPALKFGAISIRTVWQATQLALDNTRSDEARHHIQTWQQELAWREFYQHALYFFPKLAQGPYRDTFDHFPWENNLQHFQAWCEGKTGYPIVDAAMRQLNETGWMHNRCRMIVASFLTKDLIIDWRWGEQYFMQHLIDGDLAANNGGWQWSASSGMDPKPLRIFNPASQAKKYDPEGEYIRQWLPELRSVDSEYLVTGEIPPLEREAYGYPQPIVDHKQQQRQFKQLYQEAKG
ncbi:FAD-binding domain-containing protein [Spirulina sp. CS-785/01]|uniref:FAD-binding domain-containing protein n=1 Tax=Spirulina sp. CS-785/01 TaxID=3021716 RepID=UPI00232F16DA|nr:FAD-binding domain-containing protein [Spirulina sp. CS-785/01]MDB9311564.1 FAD-binding domain-containing protein [Spirulina sp. CS-785/01]